VIVTVGLEDIDSAGRLLLDDEMERLGLKKQGTSSEGQELVYPEGTYVCEVDSSEPDGQLKHYYYGLVNAMKEHRLRGRYMVWIAADAHCVCGYIRDA